MLLRVQRIIKNKINRSINRYLRLRLATLKKYDFLAKILEMLMVRLTSTLLNKVNILSL